MQQPLDQATKRLAKALNKLEDKLKKASHADKNGKDATFARENESLKTERDNLNSAISKLQYQYNDLHDVASTIHGKLDDSIRRLTQIIEN